MNCAGFATHCPNGHDRAPWGIAGARTAERARNRARQELNIAQKKAKRGESLTSRDRMALQAHADQLAAKRAADEIRAVALHRAAVALGFAGV